ncbi:MAG: TIGR00268 family protein [Thermodesulfobacteriota bacterium]
MNCKYRALRHLLRAQRRVAVAFSGGADSALLLKVACAVLGLARVTAFHAASSLLPAGETDLAVATARRFGCRFQAVHLQPLRWRAFVANPPDRCYHCKKKIYQHLLAHPALGGAVLLDGTNADDLSAHRPGLRAIAELGVLSPLAVVGLSKQEIRQLGRRISVPVWNAPSSSCLATRIATHEPISLKKIQLVQHCEDVLRGLGFVGTRVRLAGNDATIGILATDFDMLNNRDISTVKRILLEFNLCFRGFAPLRRP